MGVIVHATFGLLWLLSTFPRLAEGADYVATATLVTLPNPTTGQPIQNSFAVGTVTFTQKSGETKVTIEGLLTVDQNFKFENKSIGFHIHQTSNFSGGCASAGLHYNPDNKHHGGPQDSVRHVGDLGNVDFNTQNFSAYVSMTDSMISLVGARSVVGRSLVLHYKTDDLGKGGNEESLKTGNAGLRYACGPIVLTSDFQISSAVSNFVGFTQLMVTGFVLCISMMSAYW